jgi:tetratricopeptide (TPR) repeat protein
MLLASAPVVLAALLLAAKLVSLNVVHAQTLEAYRAGQEAATLEWAQRQGWVNVVEPFRASFAMGDAYLLEARYDEARPWFEKALQQVPRGGIDECKVRVNLGLTYERLGDEAKARERTLEWQQFYAKGLETTRQRPPLCDVPEQGGQTGRQLQETQQRLESKSQDQQSAPPESGPPDQPGPAPAPTPAPAPAPDPEQVPSEGLQRQLQELQKRNTMERDRMLGNRQLRPGPGGNSYPKPW